MTNITVHTPSATIPTLLAIPHSPLPSLTPLPLQYSPPTSSYYLQTRVIGLDTHDKYDLYASNYHLGTPDSQTPTLCLVSLKVLILTIVSR